MKWLQDEINNNVGKKFDSAASTVSKGGAAYKTIVELELPDEFSGKEAITTVLTGLDTCYDGSSKVSGLLMGMGRGMTKGDKDSMADLLTKFKTAQAGLLNQKIASLVYRDSKGSVRLTNKEIEEMIKNGKISPELFTSSIGPDPTRTSAITTPTGELIPIKQDGNFLDNLWGGLTKFGTGVLNTGATIGCGVLSGVAGFAGDTIGGACGALMSFGGFGYNKDAIAFSEFTNWGGAVDEWASKTFGVNTDSDLYKYSQIAGNLVGNAGFAVLTHGGIGAMAGAYACQSFNSSIRDNSRAILGLQNATYSQMNPEPRTYDPYFVDKKYANMTDEQARDIIRKGDIHALITGVTAVATHTILTSGFANKIGSLVDNRLSERVVKASLSTVVNTAADIGHQIVDKGKDGVNLVHALGTGAFSGLCTYIIPTEDGKLGNNDKYKSTGTATGANQTAESRAIRAANAKQSTTTKSLPQTIGRTVIMGASKISKVVQSGATEVVKDGRSMAIAFTKPIVDKLFPDKKDKKKN